jgi:cytochrome c peroxidase
MATACSLDLRLGDDPQQPGPDRPATGDAGPGDEPDAHADPGSGDAGAEETGQFLFEEATFGGNGRTCRTCHLPETGTISPQQVASLPADHPLFRHDGSDDFASGSSRIRVHATILVKVPLPGTVSLVNSPDPLDGEPGTVVVRRGVPTTLDTPALDPVLMADGRAPDLPAQARAAILAHAQAPTPPTPAQLESIAAFERSPGFFSSAALAQFAGGGPAPELPAATTPAQQRGRRFFIPGGRCATCHGGPMLNTTRGGTRFANIQVSSFNTPGNPLKTFRARCLDGTTREFSSSDPGRVLVTGDCGDIDAFKIPSLWGVAGTAPYFHDNSAKTLEAVVAHYARFFRNTGTPLSAQDQADILAFLQLFRLAPTGDQPPPRPARRP